jgi:Domain of unknown function (DUF4149)
MYSCFVTRFICVISTVTFITHGWQLQPLAINRIANPSGANANPLPWKSTSAVRPRSTMVKAVATSDGSGKKEAWTEPRIHNTGAFRSLTLLGALAAAGLSSNSPITNLLSAQSLAALHLFSYATWFGTMVYTTFILGITMFKNLPRKTFGTLQAKIFPKYFALSSISIVLQVSRVFSPVLSRSWLLMSSLLFVLSLASVPLLDYYFERNYIQGGIKLYREIYQILACCSVHDLVESIFD